ncbi:nitrite reductase large subunit NirB [Agrilactobacillus yilanensis]|uniref:Nitrite reductase large subunit NirB n=1 Tax=Agrilactobacillus yilanensis TaxID=2485997 RepID=A0ABW4JCR9_9LACO|nr:nitrite reductase large subunit NirB [Agrilactobacillus yilanensis]
MSERLVVIGNGMAGIRAVENVLQCNPDLFEITIIGDENYPAYNRILLSEVLEKQMDWPDIITNNEAWYDENNVRLINHDPAVAIDRTQQLVTTASGQVVPYDQLVLATGSYPFVLPVPGHTLTNVVAFRTINDGKYMQRLAQQGASIAVIGGGLLGLEAAAGLVDQGASVSVIELAPWLMATQLDETAAKLLQKDLEARGLKFYLGAQTKSILGDESGKVKGLQFDNGEVIDVQMVVMSLGIRPETAIAKAAGLKVDRGIQVDDFMRTSDSRIYAIGECMEHAGACIGTVAPSYVQAKIVADVLCGEPTEPFREVQETIELKVPGIDLISAGHIKENDQVKSIIAMDEVNNAYKRIFVKDGIVCGEILYGDVSDGNRYFGMIKHQEDIQEYQATALLYNGQADDGNDVASMPLDEIVCGCNGVTKGTILDAIREKDLTSVEGVGKATRAGTSCGKCKPVIEALLKLELGDKAEGMHEVMCDCTTLSYEAIIKAIKENHWLTSAEVRAGLNWLNPDGCDKCRPAINYYLNMLFPGEHKEEVSARWANERYLANIQNDGTFSVIPRMIAGRTTPEQLIKIAKVAEKFHVPMIKVVNASRIGLYGIRKEDLPKVWHELDMDSGEAYEKTAIREIKTCVGKDWCRFGNINTETLAEKLDVAFAGIDTPHKVKLGITACPRNCSEVLTKDFGVIGIDGGYQLYIGGNNGTQVVAASLLDVVETEDEIMTYFGAYLQWYREHGHYGERTFKVVQRAGVDNVIAMLKDESQRNAYLERGEIAKKAYRDYRNGLEPWQARLQDETTLKALYTVVDITGRTVKEGQ